MIHLLQKKFVTTAMIAISALIVVMLAGINIFNIISTNSRIESTLDLLSKYDGDRSNIPDNPASQDVPPNGSPGRNSYNPAGNIQHNDEDTFLSTPFFFLRLDSNNEFVYVNTDQISSIDNDQAIELGMQALTSEQASGQIGQYRYTITNNNFVSGKTIVFLDITDELKSELNIFLTSTGVGLICWLLMFVLICFLSKKAIQPIAENIQRQKQFVTNAGHEIKTPLSIILANTEALELFNGENKWTINIKSQITRLTELTKNLLTLAKMEEYSVPEKRESFSLSDIAIDTTNSFIDAFALKNISVATNIQKGITVNGEKNQIKELLSILIDNAVKYTNCNGTFSISLMRAGKKVILSLSNTCEHLPDSPAENLFERFYRGDNARTQKTGGQGIGLSVASSIVSNHKGNISAKYIGSNSISFQVIL